MTARPRRPVPLQGGEYAALLAVIVGQRLARGISQRELARRISRSNSHVSMIENGQRRVELLEFCDIANALGLSPTDLFGAVAGELDRVRNRGEEAALPGEP
jgi:transcriptional regulator with XRE-family HTH domain